MGAAPRPRSGPARTSSAWGQLSLSVLPPQLPQLFNPAALPELARSRQRAEASGNHLILSKCTNN